MALTTRRGGGKAQKLLPATMTVGGPRATTIIRAEGLVKTFHLSSQLPWPVGAAKAAPTVGAGAGRGRYGV